MASTDAVPVPRKNTAYRITFPILDADGDPVTGAAGLDSEVSKDAGTFADCTNEATEIATASGIYYLDLTSTEMNADTVAIQVKTSTTGAKTTVIILYPEELGDIRVNAGQVGGQTASASGTVTFPDTIASTTNITAATGITVSTNNDKTGYSLTQSFPTNFASMAITAGGAVTAGTVSDKTGYSLTQSFPTNFSSLAISVGGAVTAGTVSDKTGYSLTQSFPSNFSAMSITVGGVVKADLDTIKTQTVTCAGGVTIPAATLASTTNITGGTITTVTNLTNAPTSGDFTTTMKTSLNAATPASVTGAVGSVTGNVGGNVVGSVASVTARVTANVDQINSTSIAGTGSQVATAFVTMFNVATPVLTVASVNQTGDSYARIGSTGSGLTSLAPASTALSTATWTGTRAGYLDNLSGGAVALAATALSTVNWTNTRAGYLDNLSGGAVMLASSYSAPPSASTISTQVAADLATAHGSGSWATATGFASSTFAPSWYTAPVDVSANVTAIKAKTDNLPSDPADASDLATLLAALSAALSTVNGVVAAVKAKTDNLPASPAAVGSAMTLADGAITSAKIADGAITSAKFTVSAITGVASGILEKIDQIWRRFFKQVTKSSTQIKTYADDGTTVLTTQSATESGSDQTLGEAS